jgi:hypothetical protein
MREQREALVQETELTFEYRSAAGAPGGHGR